MTTTRHLRHYIGGRWRGTPSVERRNPARPEEVVALAPTGNAGTVDEAVQAASAAQFGWAEAPAPERGAVLAKAGEILLSRLETVAADLTREEGKTLAEASGEVARAADVLRFYGGEGRRMAGQTLPSAVPDTLVYTRREPMGVVGLITPWNFPIAIPAWKAAPALIAGNAVVLKPAGLTPASAWHLASALETAGLPRGVFNLVIGTGSTVGDALVEHSMVAAISFTGSTRVGKDIHARAARRMARVQLEMGGKNALVVLDDADPQKAARIAAAGGFGLTGQACTATSRVICTPGIHDSFVEALVAEAERYRAGDGAEEGCLMGPVISESQWITDRNYIAHAQEDGGRVLCGGTERNGLMQDAVVVSDVTPVHRIAQEEVFGPVIATIRAKDLDEAVAVTNGVPFGLSAGVVSNDMRAVHRFADQVKAGVVKVNRPTSGLDLNVPFGGVKESSTNTYREQGAGAVDFFTWNKSVYLGFE